MSLHCFAFESIRSGFSESIGSPRPDCIYSPHLLLPCVYVICAASTLSATMALSFIDGRKASELHHCLGSSAPDNRICSGRFHLARRLCAPQSISLHVRIVRRTYSMSYIVRFGVYHIIHITLYHNRGETQKRRRGKPNQ